MKSSFWYLPAGCLGAMLFLSGCTVDTAALANVINQVQSELENAKATTAGGTATTGTGQALVDDDAPASDEAVPQTDRARPQGGMRPGGAPPDAAIDEPPADPSGAMPGGRPRQRR